MELLSNKYCVFIYGESEKNIRWVFGVFFDFSVVDKFFEEGRIKV